MYRGKQCDHQCSQNEQDHHRAGPGKKPGHPEDRAHDCQLQVDAQVRGKAELQGEQLLQHPIQECPALHVAMSGIRGEGEVHIPLLASTPPNQAT